MPQHKSTKKRVKTNLKRQERNRSAKSSLKASLRRYLSMPAEERKEGVASLQSFLDKAAKKGIIHKRKAGRLKSRLTP